MAEQRHAEVQAAALPTRDSALAYIDQAAEAPTQTDPALNDEEYNTDDYLLDAGATSDSDDEGAYDDDLNAGWDGHRGDFTKAYNRQKQIVQATGASASSTRTTAPLPRFNPSAQRALVAEKAAAEGNAAMLAKLAGRLNLNTSSEKTTSSNKDKSDRATSEQVLDPRTRIILLKLINNGAMHAISGCISTGKEANVYHATTEDGRNLAVKIYKTSILVFKDRDKYVSGEFRFRQGYAKSNPRKMVKLWAEKEMRNLKRLYQAGIPCPEPMTLRSHVLVMSFLGSRDGWASPKLKDAELSADKVEVLYYRLLAFIRKLWQVCHLVHGDLSEYNILYHKGDLCIIDVSQSVEHEHPRSLEFLRMDITNCTDFFKRSGVEVRSERAVFEYVTKDGDEASCNDMEMMVADAKRLPQAAAEESVEDSVFRQAYIPQNLDQVYDFERDGALVEQGEGQDLIYKKLIKLPDAKSARMVDLMADVDEGDNDAPISSDDSDTANSQGASQDDSSDGEYSDMENIPPARLKRFQDKDEKKDHKAQVKADKAEKRAAKMPKHLKKSKIKKSQGKKH
ncbi:RIO1 family-domain-containing protein [Protomyces lactucae-debilis]|uniref:Serine/threonine-protein kinase RIO1 n=1 Tax=Protomyces lactucae-debilis TaxID=2754530 RepID=A0A1Y2FM82_PROLT|nr:RIO1 family-domain-containing protein [Protomyces lactucae-debilis]ORY85083.1 RIO1 family-domain-containing protein [Protomyces lactucae-debilis]